MTIETVCYVCGKQGVNINGLCYECTLKELFNPGAAFAAMFGSLDNEPNVTTDDTKPLPRCPECDRVLTPEGWCVSCDGIVRGDE